MRDGPRLKRSSSEIHRGTSNHEQVQRSGTRGFPGILLYRVLYPTHFRLIISPPPIPSKPTHLTLCSPHPSCPNPSPVLGPHPLPISICRGCPLLTYVWIYSCLWDGENPSPWPESMCRLPCFPLLPPPQPVPLFPKPPPHHVLTPRSRPPQALPACTLCLGSSPLSSSQGFLSPSGTWSS